MAASGGSKGRAQGLKIWNLVEGKLDMLRTLSLAYQAEPLFRSISGLLELCVWCVVCEREREKVQVGTLSNFRRTETASY